MQLTCCSIPDTIPELIKFMKDNQERAGCQVMGMEAMLAIIDKSGGSRCRVGIRGA